MKPTVRSAMVAMKRAQTCDATLWPEMLSAVSAIIAMASAVRSSQKAPASIVELCVQCHSAIGDSNLQQLRSTTGRDIARGLPRGAARVCGALALPCKCLTK